MAYRRRRRTAGLHDAFPDAPYPICIWDYPRPWLIIPTRELVALALLTRLVGGADAQVRGHVAANFHVGNDRRPLIDVVTGLLPFIGYPRTLNALAAIDEIAPATSA